MMASTDDSTFRMAHIPEESSDDESINPEAIFEADDDDSEEELYNEEELEDFDEGAPIEYQWNPQISQEEGSEATSYSGDFQLSELSINETGHSSIIFDSEEESGHSSSIMQASRRSSLQSRRRGSISRVSFGSSQSAPHTGNQPHQARRRATISVPSQGYPEEPQDEAEEITPQQQPTRLARQFSRRRKSVSLKSMTVPTSVTSSMSTGTPETVVEDDEEPEPASPVSSKGGRFSRKSTRRTSFNQTSIAVSNKGGSGAGVFDSVDSAIDTLGQGGNSEWETVAAAVAVVKAGTVSGTGKRSHVQFAVDEKVLVFLNILNHTNSVDPRDAFTVNPVNKYGFPPGEGKTTEEQQGPYVFVLATVRKVHFDEDVRYYTVAREDTGTEQRADTAWMEPIKSHKSIEAAGRAALQTKLSFTDKEILTKEDQKPFLVTFFSWPVEFARKRVIPFYKVARKTAMHHVALILYGESPYSCKIRATGINLLVLCSFVYLFLEVISLAFFPSSADFAVAVVGVIVWSVLVIELLMEFLIRPENYRELVESDKAYAPSTARQINAYHLVFEIIALIMFIPEFVCLNAGNCSKAVPFTRLSSTLWAVLGPTRLELIVGRLWIGMRTLRIFGLVRHWKKMWINNTFRDERKKRGLLQAFFLLDEEDSEPRRPVPFRKRKAKVDDEPAVDENSSEKSNSSEEDQRLKKAATIGTALMVVNSHRALFFLTVIVTILPIIKSILSVNRTAIEMTDLLQGTNTLVLNANGNDADCHFLERSIDSWRKTVSRLRSPSPRMDHDAYVLWAQVLPRRCDFQAEDGIITTCKVGENDTGESCSTPIPIWENPPPAEEASPAFFAASLGLREGGIEEMSRMELFDFSDGQREFSVRVIYNHNHTIAFANFASFLLLFSILALSLAGLTFLRGDAGRLVLHPLQRMLKIVVRYAENPLSQTAVRKARKRKGKDKDDGEDGNGSEDKDGDKEQLGNYETEQLINAISKIADLLRKCWGVAGAGIISSNLARTQDGKTVVFNPTVPGKRVYALFGFVSINGFSDQLQTLGRDVMILINDVAKVVHDEVYRWSLGDSGQCNKNLGAAFLMVFRIGDFTEVHERQARATDVVFSNRDKKVKRNLRRRKAGNIHGRSGGRALKRERTGRTAHGGDTLQLASLPGIQSFSDRALLGMLKSFAGIHRDRNLQNWKKDFRLGAGVGAFTVNIIIGMDAGWAVEGAVGSEYKIDATYLSPHVNMASRMMSATKQYGVTILLSQAVEELLSGPARSKLRHLDTVYVKGSSVAQRIFTYDARHKGVDFFLFERAPEQSDVDADSYSPGIWDTDQDLRAMRQHVTEEFVKKFREGKDQYLAGDWKSAIETLQKADEAMIKTVLEEGYMTYYNPDEVDDRIVDFRDATDDTARTLAELGDGACKCLIAYMQKRNALPPPDWKGVRPLTSK